MRILVDMDGVLADLEGEFFRRWQERHADKSFVPLQARTTFYIKDEYSDEHRPFVEEILCEFGFFRSMKPIPGGAAALKEMRAEGHQVFICTSPLERYENCVLEKYQWVEHNLGAEWVGQLVLTADKTILDGDILIDDRPELHGVEPQPRWEHVLFDQPYNRNVTDKRRLTWENWREVLFGGDQGQQDLRASAEDDLL